MSENADTVNELPHDFEAEMALLGAILFDNRALELIPHLRPEHFYEPTNGLIFSVCSEVIRDGRLADPRTIRERLTRDGRLAEIGGVPYLVSLMESSHLLSSHIAEYGDIIAGAALRRDIIGAAKLAIDIAMRPGSSQPSEVLITAQRALSALDGDGSGDGAWRSAGEIAAEAVERAFEGKAKGISTGLPKLDAYTGGGRAGTLWVLGGATSMGKSIGGQQFAVNVARQGLGVAYVHLEMDHEEVGIRLASALAFDWRNINQIGERANPAYLAAVNNSLRPEQWERMRRAAREVAPTLKIYVDDRPGRTVTQIEAAVMRLFQKMRREGVAPGLIVVDHEGLVAAESGARSMPEIEAARARSNGLKNMAKRLGVWTVALSQITKEGSRADGDDRLPSSLDLNYGSALSQAAHVVVLLHRKAYYAERKPHSLRSEDDIRLTRSREATLVVDKARGGRRGHIEAIMDVASAVLVESGEGL